MGCDWVLGLVTEMVLICQPKIVGKCIWKVDGMKGVKPNTRTLDCACANLSIKSATWNSPLQNLFPRCESPTTKH